MQSLSSILIAKQHCYLLIQRLAKHCLRFAIVCIYAIKSMSRLVHTTLEVGARLESVTVAYVHSVKQPHVKCHKHCEVLLNSSVE